MIPHHPLQDSHQNRLPGAPLEPMPLRIRSFMRHRLPFSLTSRLALLSILLLLATFPAPACSGPLPPSLRDLAVLVDPDGNRTLQDILAATPDPFTPLPGGVLAGGYTHDVHWLRFLVDAPAGEWWLRIDPPYLDDVRLYSPAPNPDEGFTERRVGDLLPFSMREIPYRGFVFKLDQAHGHPSTHYLRLATTSTSLLLPRLFAPDTFHIAAVKEDSLLFAAMMFVLMMILMNIGNWTWMRDQLLLWFLFHMLAVGLYLGSTTGLITQYLLPNQPYIAHHLVGLASLLLIATTNGFYGRLLLGIQTLPVIAWLYRLGFWIPIAAIPFAVSGHLTALMPPILAVFVLFSVLGVGLFIAFRLILLGNPEAPLILVATLFILTGILAVLFTVLGVWTVGGIALYGVQLSTLGNVLAMHLAVGMRYRRMEGERITAVEQARTAEEQALLERSSRQAQSGLFAMISHETKTPLAVIDGAVQTLQALGPEDPEVARRHQRIRRAVSEINQLVEKTLEFDQVGLLTEGGRHAARPDTVTPIDIAATARALMIDHDLPSDRLSVITPPTCPIRGDVKLLSILLNNLVENALKYTPPDTLVELRMTRAGDLVQIDVRDWGPGISNALRPHIFERYVRGEKTVGISGAGLGLYLVRKIAEWHGGRVALLAPEGGGALFRVTLPAMNGA